MSRALPIVVTNAFSLNMLDQKMDCAHINVWKVSLEEAKKYLSYGYVSYIGHESTALILSNLLETKIQYNRSNVTLQRGNRVLVCQYRGPRLQEGATELPDGAQIEFYLVSIDW